MYKHMSVGALEMPWASVLEAAMSTLKWMLEPAASCSTNQGSEKMVLGAQLLSPFYLAGDLGPWDGVTHT